MPEKHLYSNDVVEWFVATSVEECVALCRAYYADCGIGEDEGDLEFTQEPDDKKLRMDLNGDGKIVERTAAEWAADAAVGFFATTEI